MQHTVNGQDRADEFKEKADELAENADDKLPPVIRVSVVIALLAHSIRITKRQLFATYSASSQKTEFGSLKELINFLTQR